MTHHDKRQGTGDLFAPLNVATGEVLTQTRRRITGDDVLAFFNWIDLQAPGDLDIHVVLDNLSAHKSEPVKKRLAHPKQARWHLHFTPPTTSPSWVSLIENWFAQLTKKRLTNSAFTSVAELVYAIDEWASHWNGDPTPFVWTKPAADIIVKVRRGRCAALTKQVKSATHH